MRPVACFLAPPPPLTDDRNYNSLPMDARLEHIKSVPTREIEYMAGMVQAAGSGNSVGVTDKIQGAALPLRLCRCIAGLAPASLAAAGCAAPTATAAYGLQLSLYWAAIRRRSSHMAAVL